MNITIQILDFYTWKISQHFDKDWIICVIKKKNYIQIQTRFQKSWDTVQIVNIKGMQ